MTKAEFKTPRPISLRVWLNEREQRYLAEAGITEMQEIRALCVRLIHDGLDDAAFELGPQP